MELFSRHRKHLRIGEPLVTTHIVIPVRDNLHLTQNICNQLMEQPGWEAAHIFDNGSTDDTWQYLNDLAYIDERFVPWSTPDKTIYEMWNMGFQYSSEDGASHVAILNNDIQMADNTIQVMNRTLDEFPQAGVVYPDYTCSVSDGVTHQFPKRTTGTYRNGGMSGFCFMLRVVAVSWRPLVDYQFKVWYGDDDIARSIEAAGWQQFRIAGWPVDHIGQATCNQFPEVFKEVPADRTYFESKWGKGR